MAAKRPVKIPKIQRRDDSSIPRKEEEWIRYVNRMHDNGLGIRRKYEFQWVINLAYYLGYQHLVWHPTTGALEIANENRPRLKINRISAWVETRHSKIVKNMPLARVIPSTSDHDDQRSAKWSDDALRHLWRKIDMDTELDLQSIETILYGVAFMKTVWDPTSGEPIVQTKVGPNQEIYIGEDGGIESEKIFLGEVKTKKLSPFQVLVPNDSCTDIREQDWVMERNVISLSQAETMFPHLQGKLKKEEREELYTNQERQIQRLATGEYVVAGANRHLPSDTINSDVLVKTMWMKPNTFYPKGVLCTVIQDKLAFLDQFPNDYGDNVYPIVRFTEREDGSHFWPQSTIERLIPIQRTINDLAEQKRKSARLMGNPKWLLPKGSQVSEESITDEEGEIIEYNAAMGEPHPAQLSPLPAYVQNFSEELIRDMRDVGGQREASVAPPPQLTAAVALETAAEQADEILAPIIRRRAKSIQKVANIQLNLMNQEWDDERRIKIIGDDGSVAVQFLSNVDLANQTDVHIEVESLFPDLRGSKRQMLFDLWDRRVIQDPAQFLKAFRFGNVDEIINDVEKAQDSIKETIQAIKKGKEPMINPTDNHLFYAQELIKFANTPEFLRLIPERKQLLVQVLQAHLQFIQQGPAAAPPNPQTNQAAVGTPYGAQVPEGLQ